MNVYYKLRNLKQKIKNSGLRKKGRGLKKNCNVTKYL